MPVNKDYSIVADSTLSSSPPVKRAAVTYGRRRDAIVDDPDSSLFNSAASSASQQIIYRTGPPDMDEEIPPSSEPAGSLSDHELADDEDEEDEGERDASPKFQFAWKQQLKALDEQDDFDIDLPSAPDCEDASGSDEALFEMSLVPERSKGVGNRTTPNSPVAAEHMSLSENVFDGSVSTLTGSSSQPPAAFNKAPSPLSPTVALARRRPNKRAIIHDSDSDSDSGHANNPVSPRTPPSFLHPITTPKLHSSTPPTSDVEMPALSVSKKETKKGKGKAVSSSHRRSVAPIQFEENHSSTAGGIAITNNKSIVKENRRKAKTKVKAPTKKDLAETTRNRLRIAADQHVSIPRAETQNTKYTIQNFFQSLQTRPQSLLALPSSDPIVPFSSSPAGGLTPTPALPEIASATSPIRPLSTDPALRAPVQKLQQNSSAIHSTSATVLSLDSDSDDLPEIGHLLKEEKAKRDAAEMQNKLLETKKRALASKVVVESNDGDDLEIVYPRDGDDEMQAVVGVEAEERKEAKKMKIKLSEGRKRHLTRGTVRLGQQKRKGTPGKESGGGDSGSFFAVGSGTKGKQEVQLFSQSELSKLLASRVEDERMELTRKKEEEWIRRGGRVTSVDEDVEGGAGASVKDAWKMYAEKGLKVAEEQESVIQADEEDEEGSDEEWVPEMRGSASPAPRADDDEEDVHQEDITMVNDEDEVAEPDDEVDEKENFQSRVPRRSLAVLDSESDGDNENENVQPIRKAGPYGFEREHIPSTLFALDDNEADIRMSPMQLPSMLHRGSLSSLDEPTEDEGDKENNTRLMYDRSEDKENKAVVRHDLGGRPLFGMRKGSLFELEEGIRRGLSMSPGGAETRSDEGDDENDKNEGSDERRKPFKELLSDDDPFTSLAGSANDSSSFATILQQVSPAVLASSSTLQPSVSLPQFGDHYGESGFSPFLEDDDIGFGGGHENPPFPKAAQLQPGFSDLFESGTEKQGSGSSLQPPPRHLKSVGFSEFNNGKDSVLDKLRKPGNLNDLPLTLEVGLQPALEVDENLRRQADSIFDKEQFYLLETANRKPKKKAELYVNDHGFLTQTRPDVSSPEIYQAPSPSQAARFFASQGVANARMQSQPSQRHPLQTISFSDDIELDTPHHASLRRLTKRVATSPLAANDNSRSSPLLSPSPKKMANAFEVLSRNAKARSGKPKRRLERSEFVEAEAQESDDDEMFGFGFKKDDEEGEDGEDLDKTLDGLVDDQEMDEKTAAASMVLEKFKEQEAEADRANEKLHMDAVEGKFRARKRNHGVGLDDSDEEDSDGEKLRRMRRGMNKKQKVHRDNIKALGENEETRSFYNVYEHGLADDDNMELAYLQQQQDVVMANSNEEVEESRGIITVDELNRRLREVAHRNEVLEPIDPSDVSWLDGDASEDEDKVRIKEVSLMSRKSGHRPVLDLDGNLEPRKQTTEDDRERTRMQSWATVENKSRNVGTGRSAVGAAVTGHNKAKVKTGGGSLRSGQLAAASSAFSGPSHPRKPLRVVPSVLAGVADRSARFEQC